LVNFATEPASVRRIALRVFGRDFANEPPRTPARYDFRTRHAEVFGGSSGYIRTEAQVMDELREFVASQGGARRCA
jgi:hypothetical protein